MSKRQARRLLIALNDKSVTDTERRGTFMGLAHNFYIKVRWDGNKTTGSGYHPDFIELDAPVTNGDGA